MTTTAARLQQDGTARERESVEQLVHRMSAMFPEVDPQIVARAVRGQYAEFADSTVRDFVPVLVERRARAQLRGSTPRHRA